MAKKNVVATATDVPVATEIEKKYSKGALVASVEFLRSRDLLKVLLKDGEMYSVYEAREMVNNYLNGEV